MNRTTILLPPRLREQAKRLARKRGVSLGELVRESLERTIAAESGEGDDDDPLFRPNPFANDGDAPSDLSERHDHYLARRRA